MQERLGLDNEEAASPGVNLAGEQHQERAIRRRHGRALDTPAQHEQLLAEEGILGEQLRPAAQQVRPHSRRVRRHHGPRPEVATADMPHAGDDRGQSTMASM